MWKRIVISIIVFIMLNIVLITFFSKEDNDKIEEAEAEKQIQIVEDISKETVEDECIDEWKDYEEYQKELSEASSMYQNNDAHYLLKSIEDYIKVYFIDDAGNDILYRETNISTKYLEKEDIEALEKGIDVFGVENLNKLLEDFE